MSATAKRLIITLAIPVALALPGCSILNADENAKTELEVRLMDELTVKRTFTNVTLSEVDTSHGGSANALASVGGCRLQLRWSNEDSWKLTGDSAVNDLAGELTAVQVRAHEKYRECAKLPAPTQAPSPSAPAPPSS